MYCRKCGSEIDEDSIFCEYCGSKIESKAKKGKTRFNRKHYIWISILLLVFIGAIVSSSLIAFSKVDIIGEYRTSSSGSLYIEDNYAYIGSSYGGLVEIVDVSDKKNPKIISKIIADGKVSDIRIQENYLYFSDYGGLKIVDIVDKKDPVIISGIGVENTTGGFDIKDNFAYVTYTFFGDSEVLETGLKVVDISDKKNPEVISGIDTSHSEVLMYWSEDDMYTSDIFIRDDYAYLIDFEMGLIIINIKNKEDPYIVTSYDTETTPTSIFVYENYAYISGFSSFLIIDILDKENPTYVGSYDLPDISWGIYVDRNYAYLTCLSYGLLALDVSVKQKLI